MWTKKEYKYCLNCNKKIYRKPKHEHCWQLIKFCSRKCCQDYNYYNYRKIRRQQDGFKAKKITANCLWCEKEFIKCNTRNKYCSDNCRAKYKSHSCSKKENIQRHTKKCIVCNKEFLAKAMHHNTCGKKMCVQRYQDNKRKYTKYKSAAKKCNRSFTLTFNEFEKLCLAPCFYCGKEKSQIQLNGVDRIDNSKGYIKSNCVPCCKSCNYLKGRFNQKEFAEQIIACYNWAKTFTGDTKRRKNPYTYDVTFSH